MVRYSKEDVLNQGERLQLIDGCKNLKEKFIIRGLLYTGMRAGEFSAMKKEWVDWQKQIIHIPLYDGDWKPKTTKGSRDIPFHDKFTETLLAWFKTRSIVGMSRVTIFRIVRKVASRITPFKKAYPHSLRATYASMLAEKGLSAADLMFIMGWSKIETANNYVRSTAAIENFREKFKE